MPWIVTNLADNLPTRWDAFATLGGQPMFEDRAAAEAYLAYMLAAWPAGVQRRWGDTLVVEEVR